MANIISQVKRLADFDIIIGVDPDVSRSGVAMKYNGEITVGLMKFFELYDYLIGFKGHKVLVRIDAGWLNKPANFRKMIKDDKTGEWVPMPDYIKERIASKVGRNEQTGKLIEEMCNHLGLECQLVKPDKSKWSPELFKQATSIETRNQEEIDAGVLVI
jgi:hypothetical protein